MSFHAAHIRFLEHTGLAKPYLERNFLPPTYIGKDGEANVDNIASSLNRLTARSNNLAKDEKLKPAPTTKYDPDKVPDPLDFGSKPTNPDLQTIELPLISDVWNGSEPINYHAQIAVGTPPQTFYVDLDTGSSLFWLQSILDPNFDPEIPGQDSYCPRKSLAAVDQDQSDRAKYGDGDLVTVSLFKDRVTVGKKLVPSVLIGAAPTSQVKVGFQISKANGLLGLGFPTDPANAGRRNLVQTLFDQRMVKHASFALIGPRVDPKLAEKIDNKTIMQPRGTFVIGSVDPAYYTGSIAWCPQTVAKNRWIVKLDRILINGQVAFENQLALVDTGTAYLVASPANYDKTQKYITGAAPIEKKGGNMFSFPSESLQKVGFVFGGREFRLHPQDFGLGGVQSQSGKMCSSIVRLPEWQFEDNLWVIGGIFLDNVVTIFDYEARKVGFADISEKDLAGPEPPSSDSPDTTPKSSAAPGLSTAAPGGAPAAAAPSVAAKEHAPEPPKLVASDLNFCEVAINQAPPAGREFSQRITLTKRPACGIAVGFNSIDLGPQHIRAIAFADDNHYDSFRLNFNASADTDTHGVSNNPNSDTLLRYGKAAWLRNLPNDPSIQVGRWSIGTSYPKGKQLPSPGPSTTIKFPRSFPNPPKVVLWLCGMDFSKSVNWRLQATVDSVTTDEFTMTVGSWKDTILYKADVCWIAHADVPGIQSGIFSTEDGRASGWALEASGFAKFKEPFLKPPRLVAALKKLEFGCGRDLRVMIDTDATTEGINWKMNSSGNAHPYITAWSYIAFDPVSFLLSHSFHGSN
ncbi:MAG: hypothetical protein Q9166_002094 [cf. Caloplaca sp. 2 TL-2023]